MGNKYGSAYTGFYNGPRPVDIPDRLQCDHRWDEWQDFADGSGGTMVCGKCGMTAINWSLIPSL